ncbi:MAG: HAD family hydrolase [Thermoplasmatota archaeon]
MIKLVATDLDGTLVHDRKMHPNDRKAIIRLLSNDIPVVPVTTRMRYSSSEILRDVPIFEYPIVCMNGAVVNSPGWDSNDCEIWMEKTHKKDIAETISSYADKKGYEISTIFAERKFWKVRDCHKPGSLEKDPITWLVEKNQDALEYGSPISFMMHSDRNGKNGLKDMEEFSKSQCGRKVTIHRHHRMGEWIALTIYPDRINKRNALEFVCDKMGVSLKEVLAIGDDQVDKEMLESAGVGIAMGNSPEYIKDVADDVAPSCLDQGFSWAANKYLL